MTIREGQLVLADGSVFWGHGAGATGEATGEVCFNTSMTGYQEILTDPSYSGQIVTFTFPHIGNTGVNAEDIEDLTPAARKGAVGAIFKADVTDPSNYRSTGKRSGCGDLLNGPRCDLSERGEWC